MRVRVVNEYGEPVADVPVALRSARRGYELVRATTGADGTAELLARQHRAALRAEGARVGVAAFLRAPVEADVDLDDVPRAPIELRLPPCGRLEVVIAGAESAPGRPLRAWAELTARMEGLLGEEAARFAGDERWTRDGRARFAPIGLGLELRVGVEAQEHEERALVVDGPVAAGETRTVVLALGAREPVVVGRIVAADGRPLGPGRLEVRAIAARESAGRQCDVDAQGRFRCMRSLAVVQRLELELVSPMESASAGEVPAPDLRGDETDLGDVVLAPAPIVLRGRVRDEGGAPVRGASLGVFVQGQNQYLFGLRADARGRFESHKYAPGVTHLRIHARADDCQARWLDDVPVGDADLEIVLARGGWIRGRLEFVPNLFPTLRVTRDGATVQADGPISREGFRLGPLPAGRYTLAAKFPWSELGVVIEGVEVLAGEATSDPRLDPLDLRRLLPIVNLEVVDEDGAPVRDAAITWLKSDEEALNLYPRRAGDAWTVAVPLPAQLRVEAPGYRPRELEVAADQRVVLARGLPLRFEFDGEAPLLPVGWSLAGELRETSLARRYLARQRIVFTEGVALAWASRPGPHELELVIVLSEAAKELVRAELWDSATSFEVRAEAAPQLVRLAAPAPEEVARTVEQSR